ncbi:hypothetical protein D3C72_1236970 [compost metagenome]
MRRHLFDHVVEEADAGFDLHRPGAVQIDSADDARLLGIAHSLTDAGAAHLGVGGAQGDQQSVVDLGLQRNRQPHPLARRVSGQAEPAQVLDDSRRIRRARDDHRPDPGLQRHEP